MAPKKPAKFAKEKKQDVVGGKKMPWGFEAKKSPTKKKAPPKMSKGAATIANTLAVNSMTMGPPTGAGGAMNMGMMGPEAMGGMVPPPPMPKKKPPVKKGKA